MDEYMKKALDLIGEYAELDGSETEDSQLIADLGLNSLEFMEIVNEIEDNNQITLTDSELKEIFTVGDIAKLMKAKGI